MKIGRTNEVNFEYLHEPGVHLVGHFVDHLVEDLVEALVGDLVEDFKRQRVRPIATNSTNDRNS